MATSVRTYCPHLAASPTPVGRPRFGESYFAALAAIFFTIARTSLRSLSFRLAE